MLRLTFNDRKTPSDSSSVTLMLHKKRYEPSVALSTLQNIQQVLTRERIQPQLQCPATRGKCLPMNRHSAHGEAQLRGHRRTLQDTLLELNATEQMSGAGKMLHPTTPFRSQTLELELAHHLHRLRTTRAVQVLATKAMREVVETMVSRRAA